MKELVNIILIFIMACAFMVAIVDYNSKKCDE